MFTENSRKRLFFLLLFIPLLSYANNIQNITQKALDLNLYKSYVWKNLIHVKDGIPSINDPSFLLSHPNFSLKNELQKTIESFFKTKHRDDRHAICKYPARYIWIKKKLDLTDRDFPKVTCQSFKTYLKKTAASDLKLIFVSENPSNPSSMMGHVFFKLLGEDKQGIKREHAISFFTVIDSFNIPSLLVRSTITGMKGFFLLRPYKEQIARYTQENKNIWEYGLNLSAYEKQLIFYHFWELKDANIKYLYTGFNCATIVHDMLSITSSKLSKDDHLWVTPKDVIKDAKNNKLIKDVNLKASNEWYIKMLIDKLNTLDNSKILDNASQQVDTLPFSADKETMFFEKEFLLAYAQYRYKNRQLSKTQLNKIKKSIEEKRELFDTGYGLDLSNYKDPLNTFNDTQVSLSYIYDNNEQGILLGFLPASNTLYDDNREYFGESDLRIMELNVLLKCNEVEIDSFNLYSMKSLLPRDQATGGISSAFNLNYESHYNSSGEYKAYNLSAGVGYTKQYFNDIFVYALLNVGVAYGESKFYPYVYPEVGLLVYEAFDMKTVLNYKYMYNQFRSNEGYHDIKLEQSLFIDKTFRLGIGAEYKSILEEDKTSYKFSVSYFF